MRAEAASMRYLVRVYRLGEGKRREKDSVMIAESEWDANEDFSDDIGEQAGSMITEAVDCDLAMLMEKKSG
jgi:hypothetical protein